MEKSSPASVFQTCSCVAAPPAEASSATTRTAAASATCPPSPTSPTRSLATGLLQIFSGRYQIFSRRPTWRRRAAWCWRCTSGAACTTISSRTRSVDIYISTYLQHLRKYNVTNIHVPHTGRQPGQVPEARDEAARVHGPRVHRPAHQAVSAVTGLELSTRQLAKSHWQLLLALLI